MYTVTLLKGAPSMRSAAHPRTTTESDCPTVVLVVTLSTAESMCPNGGAPTTVKASGPNAVERDPESMAITVTECDPGASAAAE